MHVKKRARLIALQLSEGGEEEHIHSAYFQRRKRMRVERGLRESVGVSQ